MKKTAHVETECTGNCDESKVDAKSNERGDKAFDAVAEMIRSQLKWRSLHQLRPSSAKGLLRT